MQPVERQTVIAHGRLAMRELRFAAARERRHGLQVMTFEQVSSRMAGGLSRPVEYDSLRVAIKSVLPETKLGELDGIKALPGMVTASADTLYKAWLAGIDLQARASDHPRLRSIATLEEAVLRTLPPTMMRPVDIVNLGLKRIHHAKALFGPVDIVGITELSPCWRPLIQAIALRVPVRWIAGPRSVPEWIDESIVEIVRSKPEAPKIVAVTAANTYHEALEAFRWARQLLATGKAKPEEIAIASVNPSEYDDHFVALRRDANINLHFVHGAKVTTSWEGQAAAALADTLMRGVSQTRIRRLNALLAAGPGPFQDLPQNWTRILPADAPLSSPEAWVRLIDRLTASDWPDGEDHGSALAEIIATLAKGIDAAEEAGEQLLPPRALPIWRRALDAGATASLDRNLEGLHRDDRLDPCASICWMPASSLAASPRRFVRLLGLNSSRWPRGISEDRLLSDHIIPTSELDPLPVAAADRRDFETILATTGQEVVVSLARRDDEGRLRGRSELLFQTQPEETYLRRNGVPAHAFSETDRLLARPLEVRAIPQAAAASTCWRNWHRKDLTPHDGPIRSGHPVLRIILDRTHSASSLRQLLRNPLGFVWRYALRWRSLESSEDPLILDPPAFGDLVHMVLDRALRTLEADGGLSMATEEQIADSVDRASGEIAHLWETERAVPPPLIWRRTLEEARELSSRGLSIRDEDLSGSRSYSEVPFGGAEPKSDAAVPWDPKQTVEIPAAGFRIAGYIDRFDISADGHQALVCDYKTGQPPSKTIAIDGGKELQRCLYAFAAQAMLGSDVDIRASLSYLRTQLDLELDAPKRTLLEVAVYLAAARENLVGGGTVIGIDAGQAYDDLAFALPANAKVAYCERKMPAVMDRLGDAANVWSAT